jgi:hypothetical protein
MLGGTCAVAEFLVPTNQPPAPPALQQFIDDEMLRAPLLFDQIVDGTLEAARKALGELKPVERSIVGDLMQALLNRRTLLGKQFVDSLQQQMHSELGRSAPVPAHAAPAPPRALSLSLVDEESVAVDVQLSHTIDAIKSVAEYELRELQTFISALVGDMDVARQHNPLRPEVYARALWSAAQVLPLSRGHQVFFMRHAAQALAQVLRRSYAAASSRLESQGIEPAAYRTLILPAGSRRGGRSIDTTYSPDLHGLRESIDLPLEGPATSRSPLSFHGQAPPSPSSQRWKDVAAQAHSVADRQAVELVSRLFDAIAAEERLPDDMKALLARLHGPAMRLTLRDGSTLDKDDHPLWRFVNRLAHEAQMAPDLADPERAQLLKIAQATIDQLASEPEQKPALYEWAVERLDAFLQQRLARRVTRTASQIGALQKLEDQIVAGQPLPTTLTAHSTWRSSTPCPPTCCPPCRRPGRRRPPATPGWTRCSPASGCACSCRAAGATPSCCGQAKGARSGCSATVLPTPPGPCAAARWWPCTPSSCSRA